MAMLLNRFAKVIEDVSCTKLERPMIMSYQAQTQGRNYRRSPILKWQLIKYNKQNVKPLN